MSVQTKALNLLQIYKGSKQYGPKVLFDQVGLTINEGEHIGVIGPNGAGKTTLFKILVGQESLDSGEITKSNSLRIGYLEQESEWSLDQTSENYLAENCIKPIWELKKLGLSLGLTQAHFESSLQQLSGGYRMRMKLLYLIGQEPNLMLLDEPTNFLDLESILSLENFLRDYQGAFLLISHDREFLRRTTESTVEVEQGDITKFPGHIDDYFEQKAQMREIQMAQAANLETKRQHLQSFIDRFGAKATKAKQAQSRAKQLAKMETIELKPLPVSARIKIPDPVQTGKEVLNLASADLGYGDRTILKNVNLLINRGARLGIVGYNGAGKSTLLKTLGQRLPLISGELNMGYKVEASYFAQHVTEDLKSEDTILESLQSAAHGDVKAQEILNLAGSLLFSGNDIYKKIKVLSGGEKSRVALGQILLRKKPLLIMDEPTNHLDFDTVEALTMALSEFEGTLVVVSHDRSFIKRVANKILEIKNGDVHVYPGTYDEYVWHVTQQSLRDDAEADSGILSATATDKRQSQNGSSSLNKPAPIEVEKFNYKEQSKNLNTKIKEAQRKILKNEERIFQLNTKREDLNRDLLTSQGDQARKLAIELSAISKEIESAEEVVLSFMEEQMQLEAELADLKS